MSGKLLQQLEKQAGPGLLRRTAGTIGSGARTVGTGIRNTGRFMAGSHDTAAPRGIGSASKPLGFGNYVKGVLGPDIPGLDRPRPAPGPPGATFGRAGQVAAAPLKAVGRDVRDTLRIGGDALRHVPGVGKYLGVNDGRTLGNLRQGLSSASRLVGGPVGSLVGAGVGLNSALNAMPAQLSSIFDNALGGHADSSVRADMHAIDENIKKVGPGKLTWDLLKMVVNPQDPASEAVGGGVKDILGSRLATNMVRDREGEQGPIYRALDWARKMRSPIGYMATAAKDKVMSEGAPSLGIAPPRFDSVTGKGLSAENDAQLRETVLKNLKDKLPGILRDPNLASSPVRDFVTSIVPQEIAQRRLGDMAAERAAPLINAKADELAAKIPDFTNIGTAGGLALGAGAGLGLYGLSRLLGKKKKKNRLAGALAALGIGGALGAGAGALGGNWLSKRDLSKPIAGFDIGRGLETGVKSTLDRELATRGLPATTLAPPRPSATPAATLSGAVGDKVRSVGDQAVRGTVSSYVADAYNLAPGEIATKYRGAFPFLQQLADQLEKKNSYTPYVAAAIGVPTALGAIVSAYRAKQKSRLAEGARGGALGLGTGVGAVGGGLLGGAVGAGVGAMSALGGGKFPPTDPAALNSIYNGLLAGGLTGAGAGGYAGYRTMSDLVQDEQ
jgi:hypothetical protein